MARVRNRCLRFADSEHLGAAHRTCALGCRPSIFHGYLFGILHFPLDPTFDTVCFIESNESLVSIEMLMVVRFAKALAT